MNCERSSFKILIKEELGKILRLWPKMILLEKMSVSSFTGKRVREVVKKEKYRGKEKRRGSEEKGRKKKNVMEVGEKGRRGER